MLLAKNSNKPFIEPDFSSPLDLEERLQACPPEANTKGIFFNDILRQLKTAGCEEWSHSYLGFKSYSQRDFIELAAFAAVRLHPSAPIREGLRRLGQRGYVAFTETLAGKIMFGVLGPDIDRILSLGSVGYPRVINPGSVECEALGPGHVRVYLREIHILTDSYQVGAWEGAFMACKKRGTFLVRCHSLSDIDFDIQW